MELGARRGSSHTLPLNVNWRSNRKRGTFSSPTGGRLLLYYTAEGRIPPCLVTGQPIIDCHNSASKKPKHSKLPVSSNGLLVYNSPFQLPLLLYKRRFLFFVLWTCLWFTTDCMSQIAILCSSWVNHFASKITGCFTVLLFLNKSQKDKYCMISLVSGI